MPSRPMGEFDDAALPDDQMLYRHDEFICQAGHVIKGWSKRWGSMAVQGCPVVVNTVGRNNNAQQATCDCRVRPLSDFPIAEAAWRLGGLGALRTLWRKDGWP